MARTNYVSCYRISLFNRLRQQLRPNWRCTRTTNLSQQIRTTLHCTIFCGDGLGRDLCNFDTDHLENYSVHRERDEEDKAGENGGGSKRRNGPGGYCRQRPEIEGLKLPILNHRKWTLQYIPYFHYIKTRTKPRTFYGSQGWLRLQAAN